MSSKSGWTRSDLSSLVSESSVSSLHTTSDWSSYYTQLARTIKSKYSYFNRTTMYSDMCYLADLSVAAKYESLRYSDERIDRILNSAFWALVPLIKPGSTAYNTARYVEFLIQEFGLANRDDVVELHRKACSKAGLITNSSELVASLAKDLKKSLLPGLPSPKSQLKKAVKDLWKDPDVKEAIMDDLAAEFGEDVALSLVEQAIHLKPVVGQVYHFGRGLQTSKGQTKKAGETVMEAAGGFHREVLCVVAMGEELPY